MTSSVCYHNNSISWIAAFSLFLICASFFGYYGVLSLLFSTSLVLMLSSFVSPFSKKKRHLLVEEVITELQPETETISQKKQETQEENGAADLYSESESIEHLSTTEDSEIGWPYSGVAADLSDGSISDEESLIEIAIPSGQYVSLKEEEEEEEYPYPPKLCLPLQNKLGNLDMHGVMELLAEYNEEENLIEIDLSMGSIKCSRFEIKA